MIISVKYPGQSISHFHPVLLVLIFSLFQPGLSAHYQQDETILDPDFSFSCSQNSTEFTLKARLSYWMGRNEVPVEGAVVHFYNAAGTEMLLLESIPTDRNGEAVFTIEKESGLLHEEEGNFTFSSVFKGNPDFTATESMLAVRRLNMSLDFVEIDSVKTIIASAFEIGEDGNMIPLEETDVYIYVPRTFSLLPIGAEWFEEGSAKVRFPTSLPGDSVGNLTIIARIEDNELYGNVEVSEVKDWGLPMPVKTIEKIRGLGDTDAPLWMVYTLIVLLSIVWFHYLYVFYTMVKIKKLRLDDERR